MENWKNWKPGNVVEDSNGNIQIILELKDDDTFFCTDSEGAFHHFSCACHKFAAKNIHEYYSRNSNPQYKVDFLVSREFDGMEICFSKSFVLDFLPSIGQVFIDGDEPKNRCSVNLQDYFACSWHYHHKTNTHLIKQSQPWSLATDMRDIDDFVDGFESSGWIREDGCDVEKIKKAILNDTAILKARFKK